MTSEVDFYGKGLSQEAYDQLTWTFGVNNKQERGLFTSKWFDYRFMHPAEATFLYAHCFNEVYIKVARRNFDWKGGAKFLKTANMYGESKEKQAPAGTVTSLWKGRQFADLLGMPYTIFIDTAYEVVLRHWKFRHMPRPCHLYSAETLEEVHRLWEERQQAILNWGQHINYSVARFRKTREQESHLKYLAVQAKTRGKTSAIIHRFTAAQRITPETFQQYLL